MITSVISYQNHMRCIGILCDIDALTAERRANAAGAFSIATRAHGEHQELLILGMNPQAYSFAQSAGAEDGTKE